MARLTASINSSGRTGFSRKSSAPCLTLVTAVATVPWPDRNTTGTWRSLRRSTSWTSRPVMPFMHMSSRTQVGPSGNWWRRKSVGEPNVFTAYPTERTSREMLRRTAGSSSTTTTVASVEGWSSVMVTGSLSGKGDVHGQAAADIPNCPDATPVTVRDDCLTDRQPHSQPVRLGGVERLEHPLEQRVLDRWPRVGDGQDHLSGPRLGADGQILPPRRLAPHRLQPIACQVQRHLLQLHPAARDGRQPGHQLQCDPDPALPGFGADEQLDLPQRVIQVDLFQVALFHDPPRLAEQAALALDDLRHPHRGVDDVVEGVVGAGQVRVTRLEQVANSLGVGHHRRQWLVELVG